MRGFRMKQRLAIALLASVMATGTAFSAITINVPADQPTIEAALAVAGLGDSIQIADGLYSPVGSLVITQALTLNGASEAGVIITIPTAGGYGISVNSGL